MYKHIRDKNDKAAIVQTVKSLGVSQIVSKIINKESKIPQKGKQINFNSHKRSSKGIAVF